MEVKKLVLMVASGVLGYWFFFLMPKKSYDVVGAHQQVKELVVFGDSLASGYGVNKGEGFADLLAESIGARLVNLGQNGATTASALKKIATVVKIKPSLVVISLGGNDLLHRFELRKTLNNLQKIFEQLHQAGAMVAFVGMNPPLVGDNWQLAIADLCERTGVLYIPETMAGLWGTENMLDQIHPNKAGHAIMAERIFSAIHPYIEQ